MVTVRVRPIFDNNSSFFVYSEVLLCDFRPATSKFTLASQTQLVHQNQSSSSEDKFKAVWTILQQQPFISTTSEPRLKPDWSTFVSFFDSALTSMEAGRRNRSREHYRLRGISQKDLKLKQNEVDRVLKRSNDHGSGIDWQMVARNVIEFYLPQLLKLQRALWHRLSVASGASAQNLADDLHFARRALLLHYTSPADDGLLPEQRASAVHDRCISDFIPPLATFPRMTPQETIILGAVRGVLHRLCTFSASLSPASSETEAGVMSTWQEISSLMDWLDWEVKSACDQPCAYDVRSVSVDLGEC